MDHTRTAPSYLQKSLLAVTHPHEPNNHTILSTTITVNPQPRVTLLNLPTPHIRQRLYRRQSTVLSQRERNRLQRRRERAHGILLNRRDLICSFRYRDRTADIRGATSVYNSAIGDKIPHDTEGVV